MDIPVLVEPRANGGYLARSGDPLNLSAEGETPDAALATLNDMIKQQLAGGSVLTKLKISSAEEIAPHPGEGMLRDDPLFDRWRSEVKAYRQQIEDDSSIP
jgi:hypothetical protein